MRIALGLEYDGSGYSGWQTQPEARNIQDTLQQALASIAGEGISVTAAGRTDAGVHALELVVHFDTGAQRPLSAWVRGVNAHLPRDVSVLWAHPVPDEFHARFSARARSYQYVLLNRASRPGTHHAKVGWFHDPLNLGQMQQAAAYLLGQHDFSAFRAAECQARTPVRTLTRLDITQRGEVILFDLTADAFLHHMVRNMVGCIVYVGKGKHPPDWVRQVLQGRDRAKAAPTFAPDGLYLRHVEYDACWGLPQAAAG